MSADASPAAADVSPQRRHSGSITDMSSTGGSPLVNVSKSDIEGRVVESSPTASTGKRTRRMSLNRRRKSTPSKEALLSPATPPASTTTAFLSAHGQAPSASSSTDFNLNQIWKSDEAWEGEATRLETEIEELNLSYNKGHLRAFGHSATTVYDELDQMRRAQHDLFESHLAFEKALIADLGSATISDTTLDSTGFDEIEGDTINDEANALLNAMNGVCKSIQSFTANSATRRSTKKSAPAKEV
eukprot:m.200476 g.200476  ORF g.200476 m.200476 type:complete len:244 (-) comp15338_c0_seq1:168-899(-)